MANKDSKTSEKILLPRKGESAAITLKVKTAALCYERIWSTSNDVVPESIRCWGGSPAELDGRGLAADWNIKTKRAPIVAMCGPEEKKLQLIKASTDRGLGLILREIARSFSAKHGVAVIPIYDLATDRAIAYHEGKHEMVVSMLSNLEIVDERNLMWEQVLEFRADEENRQKYKRFLHWLDKEMIGKSRDFVEDEIAIRLEDYEQALKKHGIKTIVGTIEEALDGKYLLGASGVAGSLTLAGYPTLGVLAEGFLIGGKIVVKMVQTKLDFDDVERGPNSEISWVYEVKKLDK
jgi:hypothetical protein